MDKSPKTLIIGLITFVIGLALWLWGLDEEIWLVNPHKAGLVVMALGGIEALYGVYKLTRRVPS
ncbi:DUF5708 family protein [Nonomuraea sp. NPDC050663]|uniref:DUF5708 family protein n=1 Tax=Nonomuraea sp. NPDC050663 TaxID=3364370 RepID=UPI0037970DC0